MQSKNFSYYATISHQELLQDLQTNLVTGLTSTAVTTLQKQLGINAISGKKIYWWHILLKQFQSPFMYLYLLIALILLVMQEYGNFIIILLCVLVTVITGFLQEYRACMGLESLQRYLKPIARVLRNGTLVNISSKELVPGDVIFLEPGDIIPADARLIKTDDLTIDESSITGESSAVIKSSEALIKKPESMYEAHTIGFAGTVVLTGKATAIVYATGQSSIIGSIAQLTFETVQDSKLAQSTNQLGKLVMSMVIIILIAMFLINIFFKQNISLLNLFLFTITLAVAAIPEALPIVLTFCLSQGAMRLAKHQVIVKRLSAVEDLGSIQLLCTDKTGTITENKLRVVQIYGDQIKTPFLGTISKEVVNIKSGKLTGFDKALWMYATKEDQKRIKDCTILDDAPFDPAKRRSLKIVLIDQINILIVRGAYEEIIERCIPLSVDQKKEIETWIHMQGLAGNRIMAVAYKELSSDSAYKSLWELENNMTLCGCIAFTDPLKKTASHAITRAHKLGIQVRIISGDSPDVCAAIGMQLNIINNINEVITGRELEALPDDTKTDLIKKSTVFARITPEQKYDIIRTLQHDYVVGYLGDGINDAPALKAAHVSLAVQGAAPIAQEAADIILLHNSLRVIIEGVYQGRTVVANTLKYIKTTMASNLGNCYAIAIATLFIDHLPMLPIHILLVNLFSDFPMIAISTDTVDASDLKNPSLFSFKSNIGLVFVLGTISTLFDFIYFALFKSSPAPVLQTGWFIFSILTEVAFIFSVRSNKVALRAKAPSYYLMITALISVASVLILPYTRIGKDVLHFWPLSTTALAKIAMIVAIYFVATEFAKCWYIQKTSTNN